MNHHTTPNLKASLVAMGLALGLCWGGVTVISNGVDSMRADARDHATSFQTERGAALAELEAAYSELG